MTRQRSLVLVVFMMMVVFLFVGFLLVGLVPLPARCVRGFV
jgi:hypothetical protein